MRFLIAICLVGCGERTPEPDAGDDAGMPEIDAGRDDAGRDAGTSCARAPAAADRVRYAVVSHPYDASGAPSGAYEVLELGTDGTLARTATTFEMQRSFEGRIAFTPDGEVGIVAQEDGTLGVFTLIDGSPSVVHAAYAGDFYAGSVVIDPTGDAVWILDSQWRENGGGLYRAAIACDGSIERVDPVVPARLPYGMAFRGDGNAVVAARDVLDTAIGPDVHVVDLGALDVISSDEVFSDDEWIVAGFAISERHAFLGDNASFSATGNRVGVAAIGSGAAQEIADVEDPISIVVSPFSDAILVVSGFGDALFAFDYDSDAAMPLSNRRELAYSGARPALPSAAVQIERGALEGLVLISENVGVRRVRFAAGSVTDLGALSFGGGTEAIAGALGVQP